MSYPGFIGRLACACLALLSGGCWLDRSGFDPLEGVGGNAGGAGARGGAGGGSGAGGADASSDGAADVPGPGVPVDAPPAAESPALAGGDLLIVLDRSGSMASCTVAGSSRESLTKAALRAALMRLKDLPVGLAVFPDSVMTCTGTACTPGRVVVDIAPGSSTEVATWLDTLPRACGGAPTGTTMMAIREYAKWIPGRRHHVLLLTDGQPNCDDGVDGGTPQSGSCSAGSPTTACDGRGSCDCRSPTKAFEAIKALFEQGVQTHVVGILTPPSGGTCGTAQPPPYLNETLSRMAELGAGAAPGAARPYGANSEAALRSAVDTVFDLVAR